MPLPGPTLGPVSVRGFRLAGDVATVTIGGHVAPVPGQVIPRLSLEPGVRDVHWHLEK